MALLGGVNSNGLNFSGLTTGIDSTKLIEGLTAAAQKRIDQVTARSTAVAEKQATFVGLQAKLNDLTARSQAVGKAVAGAFDGRKAAVSDDTILSATVGTAAVPGSYSLTVLAQATAHTISSQAYSDPNAALRTGTLAIRVGTGPTTTVTLDSSNNTLQGLADAINASGSEARASIVNDGTATPYRLVLTSTKTGASNTITLTNNLTDGTGAGIDPATTTVQSAGDSQVQLGSGAGALTVRSATNQVTTLLPGVSLDLKKVATGTPVTLNVTADTSAASKAVQDFVTAFNGVADYIDSRDNFDSATNTAGVLLGNRDAAELLSDLTAALTSAVPGVSASANRLSVVGVTLDEKGRLNLDQAKLDKALSGTDPAVKLDDVKRLFALTGVSSSPAVQFVSGGDKTKPTGGGTPYSVNITTAATRASLVGTTALASSITIDTSNNTFDLNLNGLNSSSLTIAAGTYTRATFAAAVQSAINADPALKGGLVTVGVDESDRLTISSRVFGSASRVDIGAGSAVGAGQPLGFSGSEAVATGTDVAGSFTVNGQTETATGAGQLLTGAADNANTAGLIVRATGTGAMTTTLGVTQGMGSKLSQLLAKYTDPVNGRLKTLDTGFQSQIDEFQKTVTKQTDLIKTKSDELTLKFAAMESAISKLKGVGASLTSLIPKASF